MTFDHNDLALLGEVDREHECLLGLVTNGADDILPDEGFCTIDELEITFSGQDARRYSEAFAVLWNAYRAGYLVEKTPSPVTTAGEE